MSKSKTNLIENGILSIGIFVAGLGIQGNAKAAVNQAHSKVKYGNQNSYKVSPRVSYFNVSKPKPQSASAKPGQSNAYQANSSAANTSYSYSSTAATKINKTSFKKTSKKNYHQTSEQTIQRSKSVTNNQNTQKQQQTSVVTKLKPKKHVKDNYNAHVHKAVANGDNSSKTAQSTSGSTSNPASLSYRDADDSASTATTTQSAASTSGSGISDQSIQNLITESKRYLGASYEYGGNGQDGSFDCSGFTQYLYQHQRVSLPRTAQQQYDSYQHVAVSEAKAGDLVFFGSDNNDISHVGIYLGNGQMIDAQDQGVIIEAVNAPWWNLIGYARITN